MTQDVTVALDAMLDAGVRNEESEIECHVQMLLDQLGEMQALQACMKVNKQELIDGVLTPEIRQKIADIDAEYAPREDEINRRILDATSAVKNAVIAYGKTVNGEHLQAVYVQGRMSWDNHGLLGYSKVHPELLEFQHVGEPTVSIRRCRHE